MMIKIAIFLGLLTLIKATPVKRCDGNPKDLFKSVTISTYKGVCSKLPCDLYPGKDVEAKIEFLVENEVENLKIMCNATVLGVTVNYPIPDSDQGCDFLTNTYCPIESNTDAQMELKLKILPGTPKVKVDLVIYALNQDMEMINCFKFSGKVV